MVVFVHPWQQIVQHPSRQKAKIKVPDQPGFLAVLPEARSSACASPPVLGEAASMHLNQELMQTPPPLIATPAKRALFSLQLASMKI